MDWQLESRFEQAYARSLDTVIKQMHEALSGIDDPYEIVRRLRAMANSRAYNDYCNNLAYTMVTHLNKQIKGNWRRAALENGKGRLIYEAIKKELNGTAMELAMAEQVALNAKLIVTLPQSIANDVTTYIGKEAFSGRRSTEIAREIKEKFIPSNNTWANSKLIARTEVSKTQCALTKARAESLGLDWYIWRTSKDVRVRSSHEIMDGVLVKWSDPPNPERLANNKENQIRNRYHAGGIYNCRCYPEPVIDVGTLMFPHKVHYNGRIIENMKKSEFLMIA